MQNLTNNCYQWKHGYTLGEIIPEEELKLELLDKQIEQVNKEVELECFNNQIEQFGNEVEINEKDNMLSNKLKPLYDEIESIWAKQDYDYNFELKYTYLPHAGTIRTVQKGGSPVENSYKIQIKTYSDVTSQIHEVVKVLFKDLPVSINSFLKDKSIENLVKTVENIFLTNNENNKNGANILTEIELFASCISINKVSLIENLSVRGSGLNSEMIENASKLYVITECLLGGLFFGLRTFTRSEQGNNDFSMGQMKVHQYGALGKIEFGNIEKSYDNWKKALLSSSSSGYPFAYKVKNLESLIK